MPILTLDGLAWLISWTDPLVLGGLVAGAILLAGIAFLAARRDSSSQGIEDVQGSSASPTPHPQPQGSPGPGAPANDGAADREEGRPDKPPEPPEVSPEDLEGGTGRTLAEMVAHEEIDDTELISRFVVDTDGTEVGETMTVTEGEVILKREDGFYSVPPDAIIEKSGTLLADGNIDWGKAREAGKAWEDENLDRMEYDEEGMPVKG